MAFLTKGQIMEKFWLIWLLSLSTFCGAVEYKRGLVIPKDWNKKVTFYSFATREDLPTTFDWREKVTLSPVKNQGNCGSCWAFSSSSTFRDAMIVQAGIQGIGSEKYILDCNKKYDCNGGFFDIDDFFVNPGTVAEQNYPAYNAKKETCRQVAIGAKASSWGYVAQTASGKPSVDQMKRALMKYGPLSVGVASGNDWSNYKGGVLSGSACTSKQLNHAVQIVGWGDGHWIVRNSWGTSFGENGFIRLDFGCDGIGEAANFMIYSGGNPTPDPTPGPTPGPTPEPTPGPTPDPKPCILPTATTGWSDTLSATAGKTYLMGKRGKRGVSYSWVAEPAFSNGAAPTTAQIRYSPIMTKRLTITAKNECGSASASTNVVLPVAKIPHVQ